MGQEHRLSLDECATAAGLQEAIDAVARAGGGRILLPALELTLDRGLELRSGTELIGQGERTVLRKAPGAVYPLTGYHNYGMRDVPLTSSTGLLPGMTVSIYDRLRRGFYSTFARLTWVGPGWVGLDHGIEADYTADEGPVLTTAFPLVFGHGIDHAAVRDLVLLGSAEENCDVRMDGCRGGAVYFARSHSLEVTGVSERGYNGEGLSFQMCRDVSIRACRFDDNTGNGMHPGAGSTGARFDDCSADGNAMAGFFFCVRATRISVRRCGFGHNLGPGLSIGTRDCYNAVEDCTIRGNGGAGILCRQGPRPTEVHSCRIAANHFAGNARTVGAAEIELQDVAHDLLITGNTLHGAPGLPRAALRAAGQVTAVYLEGNTMTGLGPVEGPATAFTTTRPEFACGYESVEQGHCRHLPAGVA